MRRPAPRGLHGRLAMPAIVRRKGQHRRLTIVRRARHASHVLPEQPDLLVNHAPRVSVVPARHVRRVPPDLSPRKKHPRPRAPTPSRHRFRARHGKTCRLPTVGTGLRAQIVLSAPSA